MAHSSRHVSVTAAVASGIGILLAGCGTLGPPSAPSGPVTTTTSSSAQNYPAATCSPVAVDRLKVYPPGQTAALCASVTATGCASMAVRLLVVQTVQPGSSG